MERLLEDLLEDVLLEDFEGVLLVLFEVDVFFLLLFNEPKSKLMIYIGVNCFRKNMADSNSQLFFDYIIFKNK